MLWFEHLSNKIFSFPFERDVSQNFDNFVGAKFPTVKRYGGEGAESCIPFYREIFKLASDNDAHHVFMCMAHRGK